MKTFLLLPVLILFLLATACETPPEDLETTCLPLKISMTLVQGSSTGKILADFHYVPDTEFLD